MSTTPDTNPWIGGVHTEVAADTAEDVRRAVDAAGAAFGQWAATKSAMRRQIFLRAARPMADRTDDIVRIMAGEVGATAPWAAFNARLGADILLEAAAAVSQSAGQVLATDADGVISTQARVPKVVIAAISPWNAPLVLGARAIALSLALGDTVVMKPSEDAPVACGLLIADVLREAGVPAGVLNVVTNDRADAAEVVSALVADERVHMVDFTGSIEVGRAIAVYAARHLKPARLELGGENTLLVLQDADLDYAVDAAVLGSFVNSGQIRMCLGRVIVHRLLAEEFTAKPAARAAGLNRGDPTDPAVAVGPVVNSRAAQRIAALVEDAVAKGATLAAGTGRPEGPDTLIRPVVLTGVTERHPLRADRRRHHRRSGAV
ncbi:aldehyde dehydrogenase family protein [Streptomyces griseochromogenes]|uniref:aldehyde dehydrogenase family protein n=1 Tax=Streptomyces griseochromogenes TaxID=68214 RepID=UPI00379BF596